MPFLPFAAGPIPATIAHPGVSAVGGRLPSSSYPGLAEPNAVVEEATHRFPLLKVRMSGQVSALA